MVDSNLNLFITGLKISVGDFADEIGIQKSSLYKILRKETKKISKSLAVKINRKFPEYTVKYLLSMNDSNFEFVDLDVYGFRFKGILKRYIDIKNITHQELSKITGESPDAINDFLNSNSKLSDKSKNKYFEKLEGFQDFYSSSQAPIIDNSIDARIPLTDNEKSIIENCFLQKREETLNLHAVKIVIENLLKDKEIEILKEVLISRDNID